MRKVWLLLLVCSSVYGNGHILYLMKKGEVARAVKEYRSDVVAVSGHDYQTLRDMATVLLHSAAASGNEERQMLAMFGAGVTGDTSALPIFRAGLTSNHPQVQAAAINLVARLDHDDAEELLKRTLSSPFLLIRLEALYQLCQKRNPEAVSQLESLMIKTPDEIRPLYPQLFAMVGTTDADRVLRRLLADRDTAVRRSTIMTLTQAGRDDFLPEIRRLAQHLDPLQQEVCALALGAMQDSSALKRLDQLSLSSHPSIRTAALISLYQLGRQGARFHLESMAQEGYPFAITALGSIEGSERTLRHLAHSRHTPTRINAALALLERKDPACIPTLREILVSVDPGLLVYSSPGGALSCVRPVAALEDVELEMSRSLREMILIKATDLKEREFLSLAKAIFDAKQTDLVPTLALILEHMGSDGAFALLDEQAKRVGCPLIRDYCNLALYRSGREGPYEENLHVWIKRQSHNQLFQLRPMLSWDQRKDNGYTLTLEETSRLLIESFEALAARQDQIAVEALLDALETGSPDNWYPLAGLLFRVTE